MIEVSHLTKRYGNFTAVDDISFSVEKGEIVGFLGPNGAGKSTTLKVLTGFFPPTHGTCKVAGFDIEASSLRAKEKIGYLPENNPLYNEMKVLEFLEFIGNLRKVPSLSDRIKEVLYTCALTKVVLKTIGELSKGYRQRVGIAHSILHSPEILVMDEPTEGLDPNQIIEVRDLIKELGREKTVLISTHRLSEVEAMCGRVLIINKGKIVTDASKEELYQASRGKVVIDMALRGPKSLVIEKIGGFPDVESIVPVEQAEKTDEDFISYEICTRVGSDPRTSIFKECVSNNWTLIELHRRLISLEDVFRQLTKET